MSEFEAFLYDQPTDNLVKLLSEYELETEAINRELLTRDGVEINHFNNIHKDAGCRTTRRIVKESPEELEFHTSDLYSYPVIIEIICEDHGVTSGPGKTRVQQGTGGI